MPRAIKNFYSLLILAVLVQLVATVFTLSKNIAYGQNIQALEDRQQQLLTDMSHLDQAIAQETAMQILDQSPEYRDIQQLIVLNSPSQTLASR